MKNTKVNVSFEVGSKKVRKIGVRERDTVRWKLDEKGQIYISREGRKKGEGRRETGRHCF